MALLKNNKEIPRPAGSYLHKTNRNVYIIRPSSGQNSTKAPRITIGKMSDYDDNLMIPNTNFRDLFPDLYEKYYGESVKARPYQLNVGMYALILGIAYKSGLYDCLVDSFGPQYANAILDFAMYSNIEKSNVAMNFQQSMSENALFSDTAWSDSWWSAFFASKMTRNSRLKFLDLWINACKERGEADVWLSVDGSNDDCNAKDCDLAEHGHAKSRRPDTPLVAYITAVSARNGLPLTYFALNGGMIDSKAINDITSFLSGNSIDTNGFILDRSFCTSSTVSLMESLKYDYVLMLKSNTSSHKKMYFRFRDAIRMNVEHILPSGDGSTFGISSGEQMKIFSDSDSTAFIYLYYDAQNGTERAIKMNSKILDAREKLMQDIYDGKDVSVPEGLTDYLQIEIRDKKPVVVINPKSWQENIDAKGFGSIASNKESTPDTVNSIYHLRDYSEKGFAEKKTQLGSRVERVHSTESVENKLFVCFVAGIIRSYIMTACESLEFKTNTMIKEMDRIHVRRITNGPYATVHDESERQKKMLAYFKVNMADLDAIASDINNREKGSNSQTRILKSFEEARKNSKAQDGNDSGDRNDSGIEKPDQTSEDKGGMDTSGANVAKAKHAGGRPKGSKNKKTLEREAEAKKIGRPKGSRNKSTLSRYASSHRGRPKGSLNKKTLERMAQALEQSEPHETTQNQAANSENENKAPVNLASSVEKRKPGRPKGSKDKTTGSNRKGRKPGARNKKYQTMDERLRQLSDDYGRDRQGGRGHESGSEDSEP